MAIFLLIANLGLIVAVDLFIILGLIFLIRFNWIILIICLIFNFFLTIFFRWNNFFQILWNLIFHFKEFNYKLRYNFLSFSLKNSIIRIINHRLGVDFNNRQFFLDKMFHNPNCKVGLKHGSSNNQSISILNFFHNSFFRVMFFRIRLIKIQNMWS